MLLLLIPVLFLFGLAVGSFLNVCIDRLPEGQSIIRPPSHCAACNRKLGTLDLIPVASYLFLRGRCRYCGARIPVRLPLVEVMTGLIYAFLYWNYGPGLELLISLVYATLLIAIFVIDLEKMLVLDKIVFPGMVLALIFSFFWPGLDIFRALGGGALGFAAMALPFIIYRRGMGMGDIKLAALVGLMTGYPLIIVALLLSVITGGIVASVLLITGVKKRTDPIPFATFLAVSALVTLVWGQEICRWYLG